MGRESERAWDDTSVAEVYARATGLMPAELAVFAEAWRSISGGRVLDIGVGGGRTVPYLQGPAGSYVAIDYADAMVAACRARHPGVDVRLGDARDLAGLDDRSFDFAFFSYNSIDYMAVEDRRSVYAAVARVLRTGGAFGLCSHNIRTIRRFPSRFALPEIAWTGSPFRMGARLARASLEAARGFSNFRRLRRQERQGEGFAVINDRVHAFSMLVVHVDPVWQVAELERAGFIDVKVFDQRGRPADPRSIRDPWVHYLARLNA
jgi:SAM-dependent methyltransferase